MKTAVWMLLGLALHLWAAAHVSLWGPGMGTSRLWWAKAGTLSLSFAAWLLAGWLGQREAVWNGVRRWPVGVRRLLQIGLWVALVYVFLFSPFAWKVHRRGLFLLGIAWTVLGTWFLQGHRRREELLKVLLVTGAALAFLSPYTDVVAFPFSLTWSEGNRLWDRSLIFGRERYLYPLDQPIPVFNDPGRILLWGLIYLYPGASIGLVRFWNAFLFTVPYLVLAWMLFRKPGAARTGVAAWVMTLWGFLFLAQGPIYTPLVLAAMLVWYGAQRKHMLTRAAYLLAAGYLVRITRFTWVFAPFMWALFLFLADGDPRTRRWWKRHLVPLLSALVGSLVLVQWLDGEGFVNLLARLDGHAGIEQLKSHSQFGQLTPQALWKTLTYQSFLWHRLLPNPTFPLGILPGVALGTGAVVLALAWAWRRYREAPSGWARVYGGLMLLAFFVVGLVISTKIGGGDNLHNLDMYLLGLLLMVGWHWQRLEDRLLAALPKPLVLWALLGPMVVLFWGYGFAFRPRLPSPEVQQEALAFLQQATQEALTEGEVLFMDQRQLLTFGYVRVPLVPDYEKKLLADRSLSGDEALFRQYYQDLQRRRFSLIVTEVLKVRWEDPARHDFAEENNAWVRWVAQPTLCYYEPVATFRELGLQVLRPRPQEDTRDCPAKLPVSVTP